MRRLSILAAVLIAASLQGCRARQAPQGNIEDELLVGNFVTADAEWRLSPAKVEEYRRASSAGDVDAARSLSYHFDVTGNAAESRRYAVMAATKGDCVMLLNLPYDKRFSAAEKTEWAKAAKLHNCTVENTFALTVREN